MFPKTRNRKRPRGCMLWDSAPRDPPPPTRPRNSVFSACQPRFPPTAATFLGGKSTLGGGKYTRGGSKRMLGVGEGTRGGAKRTRSAGKSTRRRSKRMLRRAERTRGSAEHILGRAERTRSLTAPCRRG